MQDDSAILDAALPDESDAFDELWLSGNQSFELFRNAGDKNDINRAIAAYEQAAACLSPEDSRMGDILHKIGVGYLERYMRFGESDDLQKAIRALKEGIAAAAEDENPDMPIFLTNLGTSYTIRFERNGDPEDLSEAIRNHERAAQLIPAGHPNLPLQHTSLGLAFLRRFEHAEDPEDISRAIEYQRLAVDLTPDRHPQLPYRLNNLGISFLCRFERSGDPADISEAIMNEQRAVQLAPIGYSNLPGWLNNLGNSFTLRFRRTGDLDDISEAIRVRERAVLLTPDGHPELPTRLNNLGYSFLSRFQRTRDVADITEAIRHGQRTVELTPNGHNNLPGMLQNLANSFSVRFEDTGDLDDLSEAIEIQQRAVRLTPERHPKFPAQLTNLGNSFTDRFTRTGDLDDISEAIKIHEHAVQLTPVGHAQLPATLLNLGTAFFSGFGRTGDPEFLTRAESNFRLSATTPTGHPSLCLAAARKWVSCILSQESRFSSPQLLDALECVIQLLSLVSGLENTIQLRHQSLVKSSHLSIASSAVALSMGRPDKALEWLVEGRCIVWNQINQLRTPLDQLRAHDCDLSDRLSAVLGELENAGSRSTPHSETLSIDDKISLEEQAARHIKLAKERDRLLVAIRNISGFEDFFQPKKCGDIMHGLPNEGVIVIINIEDSRCDALALVAGAHEPMHIPLPGFSYQEAERLAKGLQGHLLRRKVVPRIGIPFDEPDIPHVDLPEVLRVLWSQVVWPILESLDFSVPEDQSCTKILSRIWWCPTGPLAFLPIHAAGIYTGSKGVPNQCLSDFAVSSYIPTVNALLKTTGSISDEKRADAPAGLLIVSQPNTPEKTPIPCAADEANRISKRLGDGQIPSIMLSDECGTVRSVLEAMASFPSIHLACHASQDTTNPLKSSIYLHDGPLELSELAKRKLPNSDFAFLSGCQTSTGDKQLPEEVVHLAAGMLVAGYRSVVATMWSIFDIYGPDMAEFFYESLLDGGSKIDGGKAAWALHRAIEKFREKNPDSPLLVWVPYIHIGL